MSNELWPYILFYGFVLFAVAVQLYPVYARRQANRTSEERKLFAWKHGFTFVTESDNLPEKLHHFALFTLGDVGRSVHHLLESRSFTHTLQLFDYEHVTRVTRYGRNGPVDRPVRQTTILLTTHKPVELPYLTLQAKNVCDPNHPYFGAADIHINDMRFTEMFFLQGENGALIKNFFTADFVSTFLRLHCRATIETKGAQFLFYYPGRVFKPGQPLDDFLAQAQTVFALFVQQTERVDSSLAWLKASVKRGESA